MNLFNAILQFTFWGIGPLSQYTIILQYKDIWNKDFPK